MTTPFPGVVQRSNGPCKKENGNSILKLKKWVNTKRGKKYRETVTINCQRKSQPRMGRYMDKGGNEAVRHKEHQSDRLTEPLVSLCQASSDQGQKQYYRAVCLSKRKNNNRCVPKPLEHPNSWEVGGLSVARKGVLRIALKIFLSLSLPFLESLAPLQSTTFSCQAEITHFTFIPSPFSLYTLFFLCPMLFCVSHHPSLPLRRKTRESCRKRDILLASMRKAETGRGSEQCQQIREVQKPQQEACQSCSITRASETLGKT